MANIINKYPFRMRRRRADGDDDVYYPETTASQVKMVDGKTVEAKVTEHEADYVKQPADGGTTGGTATAYTCSSTPAPTALVEKIGVVITAHLDSGANPTLNWNGKGAKPIVKPNGNPATLKKDGIYTLRHNLAKGNFILQGEGGEYGTAGATQTLVGYTVGTESGVVNGTATADANAAASDIGIGKSGYVNGVKVDGTSKNYDTGDTLDFTQLGFAEPLLVRVPGATVPDNHDIIQVNDDNIIFSWYAAVVTMRDLSTGVASTFALNSNVSNVGGLNFVTDGDYLYTQGRGNSAGAYVDKFQISTATKIGATLQASAATQVLGLWMYGGYLYQLYVTSGGTNVLRKIDSTTMTVASEWNLSGGDFGYTSREVLAISGTYMYLSDVSVTANKKICKFDFTTGLYVSTIQTVLPFSSTYTKYDPTNNMAFYSDATSIRKYNVATKTEVWVATYPESTAMTLFSGENTQFSNGDMMFSASLPSGNTVGRIRQDGVFVFGVTNSKNSGGAISDTDVIYLGNDSVTTGVAFLVYKILEKFKISV